METQGTTTATQKGKRINSRRDVKTENLKIEKKEKNKISGEAELMWGNVLLHADSM